MAFLQELIQNYHSCAHKHATSEAELFKLEDNTLEQIRKELEDPCKAFGLKADDSWSLQSARIQGYIEFFDPNKYPTVTKIQEVRKLIEVAREQFLKTHPKEMNEDFLEMIYRKKEQEIDKFYRTYTDIFDNQSKLAYLFYAKTTADHKLQQRLRQKFAELLASPDFSKNRMQLIVKAVSCYCSNEYDLKFIFNYIKLLLPVDAPQHAIPLMLTFDGNFNRAGFEKLCCDFLTDKKDYVSLMVEIIKRFDGNLTLPAVFLTVYLNRFESAVLKNLLIPENLLRMNDLIEKFLTIVLSHCLFYLKTYTLEERVALLSFFATRQTLHFFELLKYFEGLGLEVVREVIRNSLLKHKKFIEDQFSQDLLRTGDTLLHYLLSLDLLHDKLFFDTALNDYKQFLNETNKNGQTPLHAACVLQRDATDLYVIKKLLEQGADPNVFDNQGNLPLSIAIFYGNLNLISLLLEKNAQIYLNNQFGCSAISIAYACPDNDLRDKIFKLFHPKMYKNPIFNGESWFNSFRVRKTSHSFKNTIGMLIDSNKVDEFMQGLTKDPGVFTASCIAKEILPLLIKRGKISFLDAIFSKNPKLLTSVDNVVGKKLFCDVINTSNQEIIKLFLKQGAEKYCQEPDMQQLIFKQKDEIKALMGDNKKRKQPEFESGLEEIQAVRGLQMV